MKEATTYEYAHHGQKEGTMELCYGQHGYGCRMSIRVLFEMKMFTSSPRTISQISGCSLRVKFNGVRYLKKKSMTPAPRRSSQHE